MRKASAGEGSLSTETNPSSVAHLPMRATFSHKGRRKRPPGVFHRHRWLWWPRLSPGRPLIYDRYMLGLADGWSVPRAMRSVLKAKTSTKRRPKSGDKGGEAEDGTLTDRAYRELEEMIVTLQLSPGTILSEQALAQRLKIGRTPIREALQRLARDGLVVI